MNLFVTGTDTGAGKTYVSALLIRALREAGIDVVGMKPLCCGDRDDALLLHAAAEEQAPLNLVNPVWLRTPAAPYVAAMIEERAIDLELIRDAYAQLAAAHEMVVVEGAGGWLVPIRRDYFISDFARELGLPVLLVAPNRLGVLNHALLTLAAVHQAGLRCAGILLNCLQPVPDPPDPATATNRAILETLVEPVRMLAVEFGQRILPQGDVARLLSYLRQ